MAGFGIRCREKEQQVLLPHPWCTWDRGTITGDKKTGYVRELQEGGMDGAGEVPSKDLVARCDEMNGPERERWRSSRELLFLSHLILAACAWGMLAQSAAVPS